MIDHRSPLDRRALLAAGIALPLLAGPAGAQVIDVRAEGARGDGATLDHAAINRAIARASALGGGTVLLHAGRYLCFSIRLRSNVTLALGPGAVIVAADPARDGGSYDLPEPNAHDHYQDFGHSHWQNSLIWGDGLENVAILGPGLIDGSRGLTRDGPGAPWQNGVGSSPLSMRGMAPDRVARLERSIAAMQGRGNKAIALRNCRHVTLRDFRVLMGGHFAVLATGVHDLAIDNLLIDTNRDGMDVDACRNVHVRGCTVNAPNDDAICLKSSLALGDAPLPTENVTVSDCIVSGYDAGSVLDGTYGRTQQLAPDRDGVTGRIKLGTESSGGFRNITIANCVFDRCRGLAFESVDGADLENVTVTNLTMREVTTAPIFLRLGDRHRTAAPPERIARLRGITIANVIATGIDHRYAATIAGLPGNPVEDVTLRDIRLDYRGGGTVADAARAIPEEPAGYPDPSMFGILPAYGLYVRHARGVRVDGLEVTTATPDRRPALVLDDTADVRIADLAATGAIVQRGSRDVKIHRR